MVKLHVLKEPRETFTVHKNILCHYSNFFETILRDTEELDVYSDAVATGIFINWLYTKTLVG
jgi:hypothetical protein